MGIKIILTTERGQQVPEDMWKERTARPVQLPVAVEGEKIQPPVHPVLMLPP